MSDNEDSSCEEGRKLHEVMRWLYSDDELLVKIKATQDQLIKWSMMKALRIEVCADEAIANYYARVMKLV